MVIEIENLEVNKGYLGDLKVKAKNCKCGGNITTPHSTIAYTNELLNYDEMVGNLQEGKASWYEKGFCGNCGAEYVKVITV